MARIDTEHRHSRAPAYLLACALLASASACGGDDGGWQIVHRDLPGALLSAWGTGADDVWAVGADARDGTGPLVLHYDGTAWSRLETGRTEGDLWWIHGFAGGPLFMGGAGGVILRYQDGVFTEMDTPGTNTVFGLWGATPSEMWAVGGASDARGGFVWRLDGDAWIEEPSVPADLADQAAVWKVFGTGPDDVYLVGSNGVCLYWNGTALTESPTGVGSSLFTVHGGGGLYAAVGGLATGIVVENDGSGWQNATPDPAPYGLSGVILDGQGGGYAVGQYGTVLARRDGAWQAEELDVYLDQNLHAVWTDPDGGVWAVGGQTAALPLTEGVMIHKGDEVATGGL